MEELLGQPGAFRKSGIFAGVKAAMGQVTDTIWLPIYKNSFWGDLYEKPSCLSSSKAEQPKSRAKKQRKNAI